RGLPADRPDGEAHAGGDRRARADPGGPVGTVNDVQPLIFEISTPGARALDVPPCDVPNVEIDPAVASFIETGLPEVGQLDLVRHYTRLSNRTFCVDANFYPLGSCTMNYNPKVNEALATLDGFTSIH